MSCAKFEADVALYAGGDLPAERVAHVESHLAECADCRALLDELCAEKTLLTEMRDEPLEEAMVAHVHRRVLAEVAPAQPAPAQPARLYWKLALAAALLLAVVLAWPRHHRVQAPLVAQVPPPSVAPAPPQPPVVRVSHRVARHRRRAPVRKPGPPLLVQFVTDDPNIVIYWLIDQQTQGD